MTRIALAALALEILAGSAAQAQTVPVEQASDRLMIVNGNTGRVIYDDRRDDLFCVTRAYIAGYNRYGNPIYRRNMRCR